MSSLSTSLFAGICLWCRFPAGYRLRHIVARLAILRRLYGERSRFMNFGLCKPSKQTFNCLICIRIGPCLFLVGGFLSGLRRHVHQDVPRAPHLPETQHPAQRQSNLVGYSLPLSICNDKWPSLLCNATVTSVKLMSLFDIVANSFLLFIFIFNLFCVSSYWPTLN